MYYKSSTSLALVMAALLAIQTSHAFYLQGDTHANLDRESLAPSSGEVHDHSHEEHNHHHHHHHQHQAVESSPAPKVPVAGLQAHAGQSAGQNASAVDAHDEIRRQMSSSLGGLFNKVPHALRGAYEEISPDVQGIGEGLSKAFQTTREELAERMEPISQNLSPYFNRAQEVIRPIADEAQKRIAPAINSPTVEKIRNGEIREVINDVGNRAAPHIDHLRTQVSEMINRARQPVAGGAAAASGPTSGSQVPQVSVASP